MTHCSLQRHFNEQISSGEVGKMEEQNGMCTEERGGNRNETLVTGVGEGCCAVDGERVVAG